MIYCCCVSRSLGHGAGQDRRAQLYSASVVPYSTAAKRARGLLVCRDQRRLRVDALLPRPNPRPRPVGHCGLPLRPAGQPAFPGSEAFAGDAPRDDDDTSPKRKRGSEHLPSLALWVSEPRGGWTIAGRAQVCQAHSVCRKWRTVPSTEVCLLPWREVGRREQQYFTRWKRYGPLAAAGSLGGSRRLALCVLGSLFNPAQFLRAYLAAYLFYLGIALGSMVILMIYHLTGGSWGLLIRRTLEAGMRTLPLLAFAFLPIAGGVRYLYLWAQPDVVAVSPKLQVPAVLPRPPIFGFGRRFISSSGSRSPSCWIPGPARRTKREIRGWVGKVCNSAATVW